LRARNPLPDQLSLVVFTHFVGLGRQDQAVAIEYKMPNGILAAFAGRERLLDVMGNG
jgi:hypothetical protein